MLTRLSKVYAALPFPGSLVEQPLGLLLIGESMRTYAEIHDRYTHDREHLSDPLQKIYLEIAFESVKGE